MEVAAAKKRRGRPRKVAIDLCSDDENERKIAAGSGAMDMAGPMRVTRRNPGGRRALADLPANTAEEISARRGIGKAAIGRKPVANKQEKQSPREASVVDNHGEQSWAPGEKPQELAKDERRKEAPIEPSLHVVLEIEKSPRPAIPTRGRARRAALARKDAEAAGEKKSGLRAAAFCTEKEAERTEQKIGSEDKAAFRRVPLPEVPGLPSDYEARLAVVRRVCQTISAEVQARCEALKATVDIQLPAVLTQLKLQQSKFSAEQLAMPLDKFVQKYCIHSRIVEREDGSLAVVRNESVPVDVVKASAEDGRQRDGGLFEAPGQQVLPTPGRASFDVAAGECNISSTSKWLPRGPRRDKERDLGEIMAAYIQASASHDFSLTSPTTATPAIWRRSNIWNAPLSATRQPQGFGMTPRSERRPQRGELLMSINGSPLGHYG